MWRIGIGLRRAEVKRECRHTAWTSSLILVSATLLASAVRSSPPGYIIRLPEELAAKKDALWRYTIGYVVISYDAWNLPVVVYDQPEIDSDTLLVAKSFKDAIAEDKIQLLGTYGHGFGVSLDGLKGASRFALSNLWGEIPVLQFKQVDGGFWVEALYNIVDELRGWMNVSPRRVLLFESDDMQSRIPLPVDLFSQDTVIICLHHAPHGFVRTKEAISNGWRWPQVLPCPQLRILEVEGDWMKVVKEPMMGESRGDTLWMRWREKSKILVLPVIYDPC